MKLSLNWFNFIKILCSSNMKVMDRTYKTTRLDHLLCTIIKKKKLIRRQTPTSVPLTAETWTNHARKSVVKSASTLQTFVHFGRKLKQFSTYMDSRTLPTYVEQAHVHINISHTYIHGHIKCIYMYVHLYNTNMRVSNVTSLDI